MKNPGFTDNDGKRKSSSGSPEFEMQISDEDLDHDSNFQAKLTPQLIAALAANMGAFAFGNLMCWAATAVPKLREESEEIGKGDFDGISSSSLSWISSIVTLGACVACMPIGFLVDLIGRRKAMLCLSLPQIAGWLVIYFAKNVPMIIAGRFITGFCGGAYSLTAPTFIAETSQPKIRGMLINGFDLMNCVGMLFILVIGKYLSWRDQSLVCAFIPISCFVIMYFMPESPRYLVSKNMTKEACQSLRWLRGASRDGQVKQELQELITSIEDSRMNSPDSKIKALFDPPVRKAVILSFLLFFFQVLTGLIAVLFYTVDIFRDAGSSINEYDASIIIGAIQIVAAVGSALVVDRFGRRILMIGSEIVMVISLGGLGAFFNVQDSQPTLAQDSLQWLPLTSLIIYVMAYSVGMGPVPYSVMPEILPQHVRGFASSILTTLKWGIAFLMTRFFPNLIEALGYDGAYWFFAGFCFVGTFYVYFFIPETKGKTLEEIQLYFAKK